MYKVGDRKIIVVNKVVDDGYLWGGIDGGHIGSMIESTLDLLQDYIEPVPLFFKDSEIEEPNEGDTIRYISKMDVGGDHTLFHCDYHAEGFELPFFWILEKDFVMPSFPNPEINHCKFCGSECNVVTTDLGSMIVCSACSYQSAMYTTEEEVIEKHNSL